MKRPGRRAWRALRDFVAVQEELYDRVLVERPRRRR